MQKDPILFKGGDANLYGYTMQDPINFTDPEGTSAVAVVACIGYFGGTGFNDVMSYLNINSALKTARQAVQKSRQALLDESGNSCPNTDRIAELEKNLGRSTQDALRLEREAGTALKGLGGYPEGLAKCISGAVLVPSL